MSDYICGFCRHWDCDMLDCAIHPEYGEKLEQDTCDDLTDDNEVELTDEEKAEIVGDRECHRHMVEGDEIQ